MTKLEIINKTSAGFTLVELMITLVISSIISAAIFSTYLVQQKSYTAQSDVTKMQQNLRAGLMILARDIRMAGLDPTQKAGAGFVAAQNDALVFTADLDGDGRLTSAGENIAFYLTGYNTTPTPGTTPTLERATSAAALALTLVSPNHFEVTGGNSPLAEYIERLEFYYLLDDGTTWTTSPTAAQLQRIAAVRISMLARAAKPDMEFTNNMTYNFPSGASWTPNDNYRRRMLIMTIDCRNMGLSVI